MNYGFLDLSNIRPVESSLTSFSALGTENNLAAINLDSTGGDKGLHILIPFSIEIHV